MVTGKYFRTLPKHVITNLIQDIAPNYYDISTFGKGEVKNALQRTIDKVRRKEATKGPGRR